MTEEKHQYRKIVIILLSIVAILLIINLLKFGTIASIFLIYHLVLSKFSGLGLHEQLIRVLSIPMAFAIWYVITKLTISWNKKKRLIGYVSLAAILTAHAAVLFIITKDDYFRRISGESAKYYTINPITGDIQLFDQPIYNEFGNKAKPVTREIVQEIEARKMHPNAEISFEEIITFFDRITGEPLIYYSVDQYSIYHFYINDGYSPTDGQKLKPVTQEVLTSLKKAKEETLEKEREILEQSRLINQLEQKLDVINEEKKQWQITSTPTPKKLKPLRRPTAIPTPRPMVQYLGILVNENKKDGCSFVFSNDIQTIARELKPMTIMSVYLPKGNYDWRIVEDSTIKKKGQLRIHSKSKTIAFDEKSYIQRRFAKVNASKEKDATPLGQYYFCLRAE